MPEFNDIQTNLNQTRNQKEQARVALFLVKEKLAKVRREKEVLNRIFDQGKDNHAAQREKLDARERAAIEGIRQWESTLRDHIEAEAGIFKAFTLFTDPREHISKLSDDYPILLLPLRLETRFKKIEIPGTPVRDQLWIRIFPDECAIDSFESIPSETEIDNTAFYWSAFWQAGGQEEQERAAWRSLVSSHGSGRAAWLIRNFTPKNPEDKPEKANKEDVILVVSVHQLPPPNHRETILDYWKNFWLGQGDVAAEEAAFNQLIAAVGEADANNYKEIYEPDNINHVPPVNFSKTEVGIQAAFLHLAAIDELDTKLQSWSQAPRVNVFPDRFVLRFYPKSGEPFERLLNPVPSPIIAGPDPSAEEGDKMRGENGEIIVDNDMKWMVDFEEAINKGLGYKLDLEPGQVTGGFSKILAIGVKISANKDNGQALIEELIEHHKNSRKGFGILPQGTPTNNTEKEGAGYSSLDDPDASFDNLKKDKLFDLTQDWFEKRDGQWLAEALGIKDEVLQSVMNSDLTDQCEARAMNVALWPSTLGYMMESLMQPVFTDQDHDNTRLFFNHLVLGRGGLPAVKIGRQPYGIYATSAFSKIKWIRKLPRTPFTHANRDDVRVGSAFSLYLLKLYGFLSKIDQDWTNSFLDQVAYVGKSGDAHQILLDAVGLNPGSVEFYQRYAQSYEEILNRFNFYGNAQAFGDLISAAILTTGARALLQSFGYTGDESPEIIEKIFLKNQNLLKGGLVDDVPLSEITPVRNYTPDPDGHNYLQWLINAASTSHDHLRKQQGFVNDEVPTALLYLMLHHALDLSFIDVSLKLHLNAEILSGEQFRQAKIESPFLHIAENVKETESKWKYLYKNETRITDNDNLSIGDYIPTIINTHFASAYLKEQLKALEHLKNAPTARLERAFVEHLDLCTYRLDAWKNGILNYQLNYMRAGSSSNDEGELPYRQGLYVGAYGMLEEVVSENKVLTPKTDLGEELNGVFLSDDSPLLEDNTNGGYISAPSLNHAVTAAILRNGYIENANQENPDLLKVNLSSDRVRKSLATIEGIRAGQSLSELLGYQLERGLHENHPGLELDFYIYQLRKAFPLRSNKNKDTKDDEAPIEAMEAKNVIDGLALIEHLKTLDENAVYPYGKNISTDGITPQITNAIKEEVNNIQDINDAVSDVAIAESVHQVAQGNYDRGAATLNTYSRGNFPPIPDVIQTPRSGVNLTHRVGIHFEKINDPTISPYPYAMTPRATAEPGVNKWLSNLLPAPAEIVCRVTYFDFAADAEKEEIVSLQNLALQPIDLLYILNIDADQAMAQIDDWIFNYIKSLPAPPRPDATIKIHYLERVPGSKTLFELAPLMNSCRSIILNSRPLEAQDVARPTENKKENSVQWFLDRQRIDLNKTILDSILNSVENFHSTLSAIVEAENPDFAQISSQIDNWSDQLVGILREANKFGNLSAGIGFVYEGKSALFKKIIEKLQSLVDKWEDKLSNFEGAMLELPGAVGDEGKLAILLKAEAEIRTVSNVPEPFNSVSFETDLLNHKTGFVNKLDEFKALINTGTTSLLTLYTGFQGTLPVDEFDIDPVTLEDIDKQFIIYAEDLTARAESLKTGLKKIIQAVETQITNYESATESKKQVAALTEAGKKMFGDDFRMFHEFTIPAEQADEWGNAFDDSVQLLDHSINVRQVDFPVDNWLYGIARVREKMHHLENINFLNEAFGGTELELKPLQLPFEANDTWLALEYPEDKEISNDKLLYTAFYPANFNKAEPQCGLLVDEWTELIPSKQETAGMTFHFDRPNSEPPQVMLLAMPTDFRESWEWEDLVDIINETFEMAKKRAIEPDQIDGGGYSAFLPALVSSTTVHPLTASLNFSFNNAIYKLVKQDGQ